MASINNWLAFSLSPHELPSSQPISGDLSSSDYFSLSPASDPPLAVPTLPFGIMEAFNRTNHHNQDWNIEEPKLEDFLGGLSSSGDYVLSDYANTSGSSSSIGISMIKNWLRNQPAPSSQAAENKSGDAAAARKHGGQSSSQSLSLSMSMGSQSTTSSALPLVVSGSGHETLSSPEKGCSGVPRKSVDTFGQRTSIYRGVTRHRWTGRYEAHLWDNSCRREGQSRKGRQVYLGGYDKEDKAARAYDLAALKYWGPTTTTNFSVSNYEKELEEMKHMTRQEYVASLRRNSSGFSRGASIYRGVTRHHQHGRWQARIGRVAGNKDLYLGTFGTQEEAAEAYDVAAIKFRGLNAVTNFDMNRYDVKSILESTPLPIGGISKCLKDAADRTVGSIQSTHFSDSLSASVTGGYGWHTIAFQQPQPLSIHDPYPAHNGEWSCKQEQVNIHQLSTHDFFQQSAEAINSLLTLQDSNGGGLMLPMNGSSHGGGRYVDEQGNCYGDYLGYQQLPVGMAKVVPAAGHEHSGGVNGWVTEEARAGSVCHGAHLFSVWNDS